MLLVSSTLNLLEMIENNYDEETARPGPSV